MTIPSEALKICGTCKAEKPLSEYYIRSNGYPHSSCKACFIAKNKARRTGANRAKVLAMDNRSMKLLRAKVRDQVFNAYGGYKCVCCGETEPKFLTLDHIDNDGGKFRKEMLGKRTHAGYHTYRWLLKHGCPPTVQVMCMNCQHGKLMNNGICPHQRTRNDYPGREYGQAAGSAEPLAIG
jgi:hypothetical protein